MHAASPRLPILLAFLAFVSLGLPDALLGVAWPSIRATFGQPVSSLGLIAMCGTAGYFTSSFFAGGIVDRLGVGLLLVGSGTIVVASLTLYALAPIWPGLFLAALLAGVGAGAIDAGVNTFAARAFSPRVVNWLHACWGIGATLGPLIMTAALATHHGWRLGYGIVAGIIAALTLVFAFTLNLWRVGDAATDIAVAPASLADALRDRVVRAQMLFYFVYGGVEFGAGSWLVTLLTESRGVAIAAAGAMASVYWASLTIGRIAFGHASARLGAPRVLRIGLVGAIAGVALLSPGLPIAVTCVGVAVLSASLAPLFPTMIALTPTTVGDRLAARAVGLSIAGAGLGIALIPATIGLLARRFGIEIIVPILFVGTVSLVVVHPRIASRQSRGLEIISSASCPQ